MFPQKNLSTFILRNLKTPSIWNNWKFSIDLILPNKVRVVWILCIICNGPHANLTAQISYGVKFGLSWEDSGAEFERSLKFLNFESRYNETANYITNDEEITEILLTETPIGKARRFFEIGFYASKPIHIKNKLRLELAYHTFSNRFGSWLGSSSLRSEEPELPTKGTAIWSEAIGINAFQGDPSSSINMLKNSYLRASFHYQYYLSLRSSISLGASINITTKRNRVNGILYIPYQRGSDVLYTVFKSFEHEYSPFSLLLPGIHLGYYFAIRDYGKVEIRLSTYYTSLWGRVVVGINETLDLPLENASIKYSYAFRTPNYASVAIFLEL